MMVEIYQKPPSRIKIRTLESDIEEMRESGGDLLSSRILGKPLEEWEGELKNGKEAPLFEIKEEIPVEILTKKKSKFSFLFLVIPLLLLSALVFGIYWFFLRPISSPQILPSPTFSPQVVSLLKNFSGERKYQLFNGEIKDFERILYEEFKKMSPGECKEIIFLQNESDFFPAEQFLKMLFNNFSGIPLADQPSFRKSFAFLICHQGLEFPGIAYLVQLDATSLSVFALNHLKSRFATAFENFMIENHNFLTSQYFQNIGKPASLFQTITISPINFRYLQFSTDLKFYYGFYEENLFFATSKEALEKILSFFITNF